MGVAGCWIVGYVHVSQGSAHRYNVEAAVMMVVETPWIAVTVVVLEFNLNVKAFNVGVLIANVNKPLANDMHVLSEVPVLVFRLPV